MRSHPIQENQKVTEFIFPESAGNYLTKAGIQIL